MNACVYRRVLGGGFDLLPQRVMELHELDRVSIWSGEADVKRGNSRVVRLLAPLFGLPPEGSAQSLTVTFRPKGEAEVWERNFSGRRFVSRQSTRDGLIHEAVGPVTLTMLPRCSGRDLTLTMVGARFLGIPLPRQLVPQIATREYDTNGQYRFEVSATLPLFGLLVEYKGWLARVAMA